MQTVEVDFGPQKLLIDVPASAVIAEFEEPEPLAEPVRAVAEALANPHGAPPFASLIKPGMTVAIGHDDPTKPPPPWQCILPVIVDTLLENGVRKEDIVFISGNGNHKKWSPDELRAFLGDALFDAFHPTGQITNHDCLDPDGLMDLGQTPGGAVVEHNRRFLEADLMIYAGQVVAHSWGGYTGTGAAIGLASTRSIASHHAHRVVNHPETTIGDQRRMYFRQLKAEINVQIEERTGKRIFYVNWVGGSGGTISGVFAGYSPEVEEPAWQAADRFSIMDVPQADILVVGLPASFAYGSADNPLITAIGMAYPPRVWLGDHVLRDGGVIIGLNPSNGQIDTDTYPSYGEVIELYGKLHRIHDLTKYEQQIANRPDYLARYRDGNAYHPIHPFWLMYSCDYMLTRAANVILAGTSNPGVFRQLGVVPARDFEEAWARATRIVGADPVTIVAPTYWSRRPFKFNVTAR
ncbi:MAG: lactate racemase domain-containing protein [Methyloligellaceae bacterium]